MLRISSLPTFALLVLTASAQEGAPVVLDPVDVRALRDAARPWIAARLAFGDSTALAARRDAQQRMTAAKRDFLAEWAARDRDGALLASLDDLRAVFRGAFPFAARTGSGTPMEVAAAGDRRVPPHHVVVPRSYTADEPTRLVISLPARTDDDRWSTAHEHHAATWGRSDIGDRTIVALPTLDDATDLDRLPDPNASDRAQREFRRIRTVLGTLRGVSLTYNIDFDRVFLDVSRGSSAFGLRIATDFPQAFAGLIVRDPVDVTEQLRLGSLRGLPVLFVVDDDSRDAAETLAARLDELEAGAARIIDTDDAPAAIDAWTRAQRRTLMRDTVLIEPNDDRFNDAYWVMIGGAAPLASVPADDPVRIEVRADRGRNRIEVRTRHVQDFALRLNDELVDLSAPFTVVIDGEPTRAERSRDRELLFDLMFRRRDPNYLFTAEFAHGGGAAAAATDPPDRPADRSRSAPAAAPTLASAPGSTDLAPIEPDEAAAEDAVPSDDAAPAAAVTRSSSRPPVTTEPVEATPDDVGTDPADEAEAAEARPPEPTPQEVEPTASPWLRTTLLVVLGALCIAAIARARRGA